MTVVYVAVGSALGGMCRYFVSILLNSPSGFPWGTLGVNVLGSLAIGLLSGWLAHGTGNAAAIRAFAVSHPLLIFAHCASRRFGLMGSGVWSSCAKSEMRYSSSIQR